MITTTKELHRIIEAIWALYPARHEPYGYTEYLADGAKQFLVFRSRAESFNRKNAVAIIPYKEKP